MAIKTLTNDVLGALRPRAKPYEIADSGRTGLLVRVQPSGTRSLYCTFKVAGSSEELDSRGKRKAGSTRRVCLGKWPAQVSLADARATAVRMITLARDGTDPEPEKKAERERQQTIKELVPEFLEHGTSNVQGFGPRLKQVVVAKWGSRAPGQLSAKTFQAELWQLVESGEAPAARTLRDATRAFYSWLNARYHMKLDNPAVVPKRLGERLQEQKREFTPYTDDEIRAFWKATENWGDERMGMPGRFGMVARLALLTGHRSDVLAALTWDRVEKEMLRFPSPGKSRKRWAEAVPITPAIREILDAAEKHRVTACEYVFWSRNQDGDYQIAEPDATLLRKRAGEKFSKTIKELRHTAKTRMARVGVRERVSEALLGHSQNGVAARYDHHDYLIEAKDALEQLEKHLMGIVNGTQENS